MGMIWVSRNIMYYIPWMCYTETCKAHREATPSQKSVETKLEQRFFTKSLNNEKGIVCCPKPLFRAKELGHSCVLSAPSMGSWGAHPRGAIPRKQGWWETTRTQDQEQEQFCFWTNSFVRCSKWLSSSSKATSWKPALSFLVFQCLHLSTVGYSLARSFSLPWPLLCLLWKRSNLSPRNIPSIQDFPSFPGDPGKVHSLSTSLRLCLPISEKL